MFNYGLMMDLVYYMYMMQIDLMYRQNFEKMMDDLYRMVEYMNGRDYKLKLDDGGLRLSFVGLFSFEGYKNNLDNREEIFDERVVRDKQNENYQIMRENYDFKI